jgi:exopolysaccharide biosynthesis polyprenyl glycosylphosphotransferase
MRPELTTPHPAAKAPKTKVPLDWERNFKRRLIATDFVAITGAILITQWAWFGLRQAELALRLDLHIVGLTYSVVSVGMVVVWMAVLALFDTRNRRIIGTGTVEYKRLVDSAIRLFGVMAIIAYLFQVPVARGYILTAFPLGLLALLAGRWFWRKWLGRQRAAGRFSHRVLLAGSLASATHIAQELGRLPYAGYKVVGACLPRPAAFKVLPGTAIPVVGDLDEIPLEMAAHRADSLILTSSDELGPERIRRLSWALEPGRQHLVVAPGLTDIGGPRIQTRPVAGLPLIHVETPRYEGFKRVSKRLFDFVGALTLIIVLAPILGLIALTIRATSPGPALFRQRRVGLNGTRFTMLKFRSMVSDAEDQLGLLELGERIESNRVLFKLRSDPRVTSLGRILRRYSIDELPQLFNVLTGSMSIVGPRPSLDVEVAQYEDHVHRRFLVKPGITGLWQVSGRSNLSWEDSVRLDLYYVENWSLTGDVVILWRTVRAVTRSVGAY